MLMNHESGGMVLDNGSGLFKIGFAGDDAPRVVFPTLVGRASTRNVEHLGTDIFIGDDAMNKQGLVTLSNPNDGLITNWDDLEKIWSYAFEKELRVSPTEHPLLITQQPIITKSQTEKMTQIAFESLNTPACYLSEPAKLAVYGSGRGTAICLDVGHSGYSIFPVYEGYTFTEAIQHVEIGGRDLTFYLTKLLNQKGHSFASTFDHECVRMMKESYSRVAVSIGGQTTQNERNEVHQWKGIDNRTIEFGEEMYMCGEALFNPSLLGRKNTKGIHETLFDAIQQCPIDTRKDFYGNLLASGGTSLLEGFTNRLFLEMQQLVPERVRVKVVAPPERKYSTWIGGSILASLSTFQSMWISKEEYEEHGPTFVHQKCI